ncbi:MAG: peroxidase [Marmoricola sp.]|nr:peroxidase [Marmoricola sp.]
MLFPMPEPVQQPVLTPLTRSAIFLVLGMAAGGEQAVRDVLADLAGLQRSVAIRGHGDSLVCVAGIGTTAWDRLFAGARPAELHQFPEIVGDAHHAVSTPGDLLFHLRAESFDLCFELATQIVSALGDAVEVIDEVQGFGYFDQRDLLGFVDGTENPAGSDALRAVTVGAEDPEFAGGSYVMVQKYLHNLGSWNALSTEEQERVVGRSKLSNIEMPDDLKPANSHVALNVIEDEHGEQLQILRDNMSFGSFEAGEFGTYYIAYARTPATPERMLRNMFIGDPVGNHDRILDFSTAVTGTSFFVPTADFLGNLPPAP